VLSRVRSRFNPVLGAVGWLQAVFALGASLAVASVAHAQARPIDSATVVVTLDHADWLYRVGDTATFHVAVQRAGRVIPTAKIVVSIAQERISPMRVDTVSGAGATFKAALTTPGFLRATATALVDGKTTTGMATAGFNADAIDASTTPPADFLAFWQKAIADARRTPLEPVMTRRADLSTADVDVYHVSFQNQKPGSRLYGMLSVPHAPGKYPAMLQVPGAGVRPYFPSVNIAKRGVIHLAIGIHGIPVDRDSLLYNELRATALEGYSAFGVEDRDKYYYKRVFVGVIRAGDFIFSLPQFDGTHYVVTGGSQGGALSIMAGVLDARVNAIAVAHPALSDQTGYLRGRAGGWPHLFADTSRMKAKAEKLETVRYYDTDNFARLLKVPGMYTWGYNDLTVPPTTSYAVYNLITAPKQLLIAKETGHYRTPEQNRALEDFLFRQLGVAK
jgi:cephalosporin-C deacetylase-like acetyl esterase